MSLKTTDIALDKILDLKKWQTLQDSLALVTKLAIIIINYKGEPITKHSQLRPFCERARKDKNLSALCQRCDARAGLEAVRTNKPFIYLCHSNIIDLAIPITIDDKYIGAIMAGQVKLTDEGSSPELERLLPKGYEDYLFTPEMYACYNALPTLTYREVQAVSKMLSDLCHYLVEESVHKNLLLNKCETLELNNNTSAPSISPIPIDKVNESHDFTLDSIFKDHAEEPFICQYPGLQPAFDYISNNKGEKILQENLAALCHMSVSYFSRQFKKEANETFSNYLTRKKIDWSKVLLERTDLSINRISDELGFSDAGYFIKNFKKLEHHTPAHYRKYVANKK